MWNGEINILGEFGKSNGQYGFRGTVATNQTGASGNINITNTKAYPDTPGTTKDHNDNIVAAEPLTVEVSNVHVVRTSATVVGTITGVAAEPYNITYRLSKDATMYLTITDSNLPPNVVRNLVPGSVRVGEGIPDGTLQNGDAWNGRANNGDLMPPGNYLVSLQSVIHDQYGTDLSAAVTRQIVLDPLQITDILVQPLLGLSTSLAILTYTVTEPATVFLDIYPPGTQFCNGLNNLNTAIPDQAEPNPPKNFDPRSGSCGAGSPLAPLRRVVEQKNFRTPVVSFWDGRDGSGLVQPDGDYVFVLYAMLPSQNGFAFNGSASDKRIWTTVAKSGFLTVARGLPGISQITPSSTLIGSNPAVAALNPFVFSYSLSRDAIVSVKIFDAGGTVLKRNLIDRQVRSGGALIQETWNGFGDDGGFISSGTYLAQLTAQDQFFPNKISTTTAQFPVNLFRITDVANTPLLTGTTDVVTLSYQLSQAMNVAWNIYNPGTQIVPGTTWPPCGSLAPGVCAQTLSPTGQAVGPIITVSGMRPGRLKITETWDGRNTNGLFMSDGSYVFTLTAQSTTTPRYFAADQVYGTLTVARGAIAFQLFIVKPTVPALSNSSQTITLPPYEIDYTVTRQSSVTVQVLNTAAAPSVVRTLISGQVREASVLNGDFWDGRDNQGSFVPSGFYTVQVIAQDLASTLSSGATVQQTIAVDPLRIYDVAVRPLLGDPASATVFYQVSETMKVSLKVYKPGTTFDSSGNPTPIESLSLVQRFVGVRPARTEVSEFWDGRDLKQSIIPDGNYVFRIVASTDVNAIDSVSGNIVSGAALAKDLIIDDIPVV
ncbi:MAG: hypothetical protein HY551_04710, partial [Elusimicrobia bacterium]|nr:hypothetical protein [Elusimicrobiota bacterium]